MMRTKTPRPQLRWQLEMAHALGLHRVTKPARILLRQLYAVHQRMESLTPTSAEYVQATVVYGRIFDRLRSLVRR